MRSQFIVTLLIKYAAFFDNFQYEKNNTILKPARHLTERLLVLLAINLIIVFYFLPFYAT